MSMGQGHFCYESVQNCKTYLPARKENKQALKSNATFVWNMDVRHNTLSFSLLNNRNVQQTIKIEPSHYTNWKHGKSFAFTTKSHNIFIKKAILIEVFLLFVLYIPLFAHLHTDVKQKKRNKNNFHSLKIGEFVGISKCASGGPVKLFFFWYKHNRGFPFNFASKEYKTDPLKQGFNVYPW
jgi:hypothetical protein